MIQAAYYKHTLKFTFDAGTSRGVLKNKNSYFIKLWISNNPEVYGLGEAGPLYGLSLDFNTAEKKLKSLVREINSNSGFFEKWDEKLFLQYPSVAFALEMAQLDLKCNGNRRLFDTDFTKGVAGIKINGLVWMGNYDFMHAQIKEKVDAGFYALKLKIGGIDFEKEIELLKFIRVEFPQIEIRLDANGSFDKTNAIEKLQRLAKFNIHSIEQPIMAGQIKEMAFLGKNSPIPIALDEELIGVSEKKYLLEEIMPSYVILKPTLLGGLLATEDWIKEAKSLGIQFWLTSALESNIGLNAISQYCSTISKPLLQGLGTGKLFSNNFNSPLEIKAGCIFYNTQMEWDLRFFKQI